MHWHTFEAQVHNICLSFTQHSCHYFFIGCLNIVNCDDEVPSLLQEEATRSSGGVFCCFLELK